MQQKLTLIDDVSELGFYSETDMLAALVASSPDNAPYEERCALAQEIIRRIPVGTTREDIEKIFTFRDGGFNDSSKTQYYFGSEVTVCVPFDDRHDPTLNLNGNYFPPYNRVNGPITIYRSWAMVD